MTGKIRIHIQTVLLLDMDKNLENMHLEVINYSKFGVETQF